MKFVLGLVALVLAGLLLYVYTDKENKQPQKQTVHNTVKEETPSQEAMTSVEKPVEMIKKVFSSSKTSTQDSKFLRNEDNEFLEVGEYKPNENRTSPDLLSVEELEVIEKDMEILNYQSEGNTMDTNLSFLEASQDLVNSNVNSKLLTKQEFSKIEEGMDIPIMRYKGEINLEDENLD